MTSPPTRVYFHVGAPKTGTTYLQRRLFANREALAADGVLYPYADFAQSYRSMQDFRRTKLRPEDKFTGEWSEVSERIRGWHGPRVIVSNELLGDAPAARIAANLRDLEPGEAHVVFTARDFARQLVSDWQEHVKHQHTVTLETFVDDLVTKGLAAPKPFGAMFWGLHDAAHVLEHWQQVVPPERMHVVTVPPPGGPKDALWQRFCAATGLDPDAYPERRSTSNVSMGVVETELVRRMNRRVRGMPPQEYDLLVRRLLAERVLGSRSDRLTLPPEHLDWAIERSHQLVEQLTVGGYDVVGDLDELVPRPADQAEHHSPTALTAADLAPASMRAAVGLLKYAGKQRRTILEQRADLEGAPGPASRPARSGGRLRHFALAVRRTARSWRRQRQRPERRAPG